MSRYSKPKSRRYDKKRPNSYQRGYDEDWAKVRKEFLRKHPTCWCGEPATEVDHIQTIREAPGRRLDVTNLRALCKRHHSRRTMRDQGPNRDKRNATATGADGMPIDPKHPWFEGY